MESRTTLLPNESRLGVRGLKLVYIEETDDFGGAIAREKEIKKVAFGLERRSGCVYSERRAI